MHPIWIFILLAWSHSSCLLIYTRSGFLWQNSVFFSGFPAGIFLLAMLALLPDKLPVLPHLPVPLRRAPLLYPLPYEPGLAYRAAVCGNIQYCWCLCLWFFLVGFIIRRYWFESPTRTNRCEYRLMMRLHIEAKKIHQNALYHFRQQCCSFFCTSFCLEMSIMVTEVFLA